MKMFKIVFAVTAIFVLAFLVVNLWPTDITANDARATVQALPEVRQYAEMLTQAGTEAQIVVEDSGEEWNVHVFEIVNNGDSTHTATFGWYRVNKKTGEITRAI
ncbi:hypothetical protein HY933_01665 [Candidatus Falkowbacteria bacterium]|nr:hypothetical protein [Candidatus Falkowbacteria bacterium]